MDEEQLDRLHERIIAQATYPGDVCPAEHKLVEFVTGALTATESQRMEEHLSACPDCRKSADQLRAASQWFNEHKDEMFAELAAKAAAAGVEPWASCPGRDLLGCFVADKIPQTEQGASLRERIAAHLEACSACREAAAEARRTLAAVLVIRLADLHERTSQAAEAARHMLLAIQAMAIARNARPRAHARAGYRGAPETSLTALVLDQHGNVALDEDANPRRARFRLVRAELESDGHLVLALTTKEASVCERRGSTFLVAASLQHENRKIVLPPEKIYADGHATIVGNLPASVEIRNVPPATITLTVMKSGPPEWD